MPKSIWEVLITLAALALIAAVIVFGTGCELLPRYQGCERGSTGVYIHAIKQVCISQG